MTSNGNGNGNGRGRPTTYTPEKGEEAAWHFAKALSLRGVAGLMGVSPATLLNWMERHPEFLNAVERARSELEQESVEIIRSKANKADDSVKVQGHKWFLARTRPEDYGAQREQREVHRVDITSKGGALIVPGVVSLADWEAAYGTGPTEAEGEESEAADS